MSEPTATGAPRDVQALHVEMERVWGNPKGWRALSIVNHSSVALRFMVTGGVFFLIAGLLAMLIRAQLARPRQMFMGAEAYHQAFTMHGTMMMFLFAVPVLQGLAAYLLPKMLGARDLVFPRLSALGYWCYLFGGGSAPAYRNKDGKNGSAATVVSRCWWQAFPSTPAYKPAPSPDLGTATGDGAECECPAADEETPEDVPSEVYIVTG